MRIKMDAIDGMMEANKSIFLKSSKQIERNATI